MAKETEATGSSIPMGIGEHIWIPRLDVKGIELKVRDVQIGRIY